MPSINTKADRVALPFQRNPHWVRIRQGCWLGYRVHRDGAEGTWLARWRDDDGSQHQTAFGHVESYDKALKLAEAWFSHATQTEGGDVLTVQQVCQYYLQELRLRLKEETAVDAEYRFKKRIDGTDFGKVTMDKLRPKHIKEWRDAIAQKNQPATVNRNLVVLLAAFNMAFSEKLVADNSAWRGAIKLKVTENRRERVLRANDREALLIACDDDLRGFVEGLMLTGCRPGELANATVSCFNPIHGTLKLSGKTGARSVPISDKMAILCKAQARDKLPKALMFTRADGNPWQRDNWQKPFQAAVAKAGLGDGVVLYSA